MSENFTPLERIIGRSLHSLPKCELLRPDAFDYEIRLHVFRPPCCACDKTSAWVRAMKYEKTGKMVWLDMCKDHLRKVEKAAEEHHNSP